MARCRNHTRSRHSKVCASSTASAHSTSSAGGTQHDRKHHPSYDRRTSRLAAVGAIAVAGALCSPAAATRRTRTAAAARSESPRPAAPARSTSCPQKIQDAGVIKVGSDIAYAPVEFRTRTARSSASTPTSRDALGKQLGVKFEFNNGTFDGLITGLQHQPLRHRHVRDDATPRTARRAWTTRARRSARASTSSTTSPPAPRSSSRRATPRASSRSTTCAARRSPCSAAPSPRTLAKAQAKKCMTAGKSARHRGLRHRRRGADPRCKAGGAVADLNDFPVAAYAAKTSGGGNDFEVVGEQVEAGPYGIAVAKEQHPAARRAQGRPGRDHQGRRRTTRSWRSGTSRTARSPRPTINGGS